MVVEVGVGVLGVGVGREVGVRVCWRRWWGGWGGWVWVVGEREDEGGLGKGRGIGVGMR